MKFPLNIIWDFVPKEKMFRLHDDAEERLDLLLSEACTPVTKDIVLRRYRDCETSKVIAAHYGISIGKVSKIIEDTLYLLHNYGLSFILVGGEDRLDKTALLFLHVDTRTRRNLLRAGLTDIDKIKSATKEYMLSYPAFGERSVMIVQQELKYLLEEEI